MLFQDLYFKINKLQDEAAVAKATPFGEHRLFSSAIANTLISSTTTKSSSSHGENESSLVVNAAGETAFGGFLRKLSITANSQISAANISQTAPNKFVSSLFTKGSQNEEN